MLSPQHEAGLAPTSVGGPRGIEVGRWGHRGQACVAAGGSSVDALVCSGLRMLLLRGSPLEGGPRERLLPFAQTFPERRAAFVSVKIHVMITGHWRGSQVVGGAVGSGKAS